MATRRGLTYRLRYKLCEPLWWLAATLEDWPRPFQQSGRIQSACERRVEAAAVWVDRRLRIREWSSS
jgi:hypothetical protein